MMQNHIKLLVSPRNIIEAETTIKAGVDYIDCKNPLEGSLGANFPWVIQEMKSLLKDRNDQYLSATIGDFPNLPGSASLAALGAAYSGADIIKVGLKGPKDINQGIYLMKNVVTSVRNFNENIKIVAAGYADHSRIQNSLHHMDIPIIAAKSGADIAMLDTLIKDGKGLFDFLNSKELKNFKKLSEKHGILTALAGNLNVKTLPKIKLIEPDIVGIRSAVCENFDRNNGQIDYDLILRFKNKLYE